jgi:crossover junction endodeoxyribonuclease RuvC
MIILGIDPGSNKTGWAFIQTQESEENTLILKSSGVIRADRAVKDKDVNKRIYHVYQELATILADECPTHIFMEDYFIKAYKGAKAIAHVQGAIIVVSKEYAEVSPRTINPLAVKKALTGNGRAEKNEVKEKICEIFNIDKKRIQDEYDAIAIAYAGLETIKKEEKENDGKDSK